MTGESNKKSIFAKVLKLTAKCYRVVNAEGELAANYAFGGAKEQRLRLLEEGVTFAGEHRVDLERHFWDGWLQRRDD